MFAHRPIPAGSELCISYKGTKVSTFMRWRVHHLLTQSQDHDVEEENPAPDELQLSQTPAVTARSHHTKSSSKTTALAHVTPTKGPLVPKHEQCLW